MSLLNDRMRACDELVIPAIYAAVNLTLKKLHIFAVNLQLGPQVDERAEIGRLRGQKRRN